MEDPKPSVGMEVVGATAMDAGVAPPAIAGAPAAPADIALLCVAPAAASRKRAAGAATDEEELYKALARLLKRGGSDEEMQHWRDAWLNRTVVLAHGALGRFEGLSVLDLIYMKEPDVPLKGRFLQRFLKGQSSLQLIAEREALKDMRPSRPECRLLASATRCISWRGRKDGTPLHFYTLPNHRCFVPTAAFVTPVVELKLALVGIANKQAAVTNDLRMLPLFEDNQVGALKEAAALFHTGLSDRIQSIVGGGEGDVTKVDFHVEVEADRERKLLLVSIKVVPPRSAHQCRQDLDDGGRRAELVKKLLDIAEDGPRELRRVSILEPWAPARIEPGTPKRVGDLGRGDRLLGPGGEVRVKDVRRHRKVSRIVVRLAFQGLDSAWMVSRDYPIQCSDDQGQTQVCSAEHVAVALRSSGAGGKDLGAVEYSLPAHGGPQEARRQIVSAKLLHTCVELMEVHFEDDKTAWVDLSEDNSEGLNAIEVKGEMRLEGPNRLMRGEAQHRAERPRVQGVRAQHAAGAAWSAPWTLTG